MFLLANDGFYVSAGTLTAIAGILSTAIGGLGLAVKLAAGQLIKYLEKRDAEEKEEKSLLITEFKLAIERFDRRVAEERGERIDAHKRMLDLHERTIATIEGSRVQVSQLAEALKELQRAFEAAGRKP